MDEQLKAAVLAAKGAEDEAKTIATYLAQLVEIRSTPPNPEELEKIQDDYVEIIGDELNHLLRFVRLVSALSGIETKED